MASLTEFERLALVGKLQTRLLDLISKLDDAVGSQAIHEVEEMTFSEIQKLGKSCLEYFITQSGTGKASVPYDEDGLAYTYKGSVKSPYFSVFGEVTVTRAGFTNGSGYVYPVDGQLNLPQSKYSYLLQRWLQSSSCEQDFREAVGFLDEIFDYGLSASVPQRLGLQTGACVDVFYEEKSETTVFDDEGSYIGLSADGKGVRMLPSERSTPPNQEAKPRLGRGEKPGTKKQAIVTVDFSFDPVAREVSTIVDGLLKRLTTSERRELREKGAPRRGRNKHMRATLGGKDKAMSYLMGRLRLRDPTTQKPVIVLIDGDPSLEAAVKRALKQQGMEDRADAFILDFIHVSEYIWDVATALHGEKGNARVKWVERKLTALLEGKVGRVIGGLRQILTKNKLKARQKKAINKTITYFDNHRHMMAYDQYLAKGFPIATGLVEGACGSLVKDRMEQSGMRWSVEGAQAVLDIRSVKKNSDWERFWAYFVKFEEKRLRPKYNAKK
jgi:hypothetical protein